MFSKRVSIFSGHYGSGKTNVAVNYAIALQKSSKKTVIYDLDIVNPYFRTVDAEERLKNTGVQLVVSPYAETNVDIPAMASSSYMMTDDLSKYAVVDLGGDDRGALAMGRFSDKLKKENDYDLFLVVNVYRPETRDINGINTIKEEIENTAKMKFTAIVNNSNLGNETTEKVVLDSIEKVKDLEKAFGIPVAFTCVEESLYESLKGKIDNLLPLTLIEYGKWL